MASEALESLYWNLLYETHRGTHTYHNGDCCGRRTRRGVCGTCIYEQMVRLGWDVLAEPRDVEFEMHNGSIRRKPLDLVDDGMGSTAARCGPDCSLQAVRPGEFDCDCDGANCPNAND